MRIAVWGSLVLVLAWALTASWAGVAVGLAGYLAGLIARSWGTR